MQKNKMFYIGILSVLSLVGLGAYIYQLSNGLGVTGMNNTVSWGLYITLFMFFVGLSAGGLIVSSSATVFNIPSFKVVAKPAVILSTVCIVCAGIFILVDIGSPERVFNMILHPQLKSPLMWDLIVISLYLTINLVYLYLMTRKTPNQKSLKFMSAVALPIAILVHSVTAWIFGLQVARESWHSAIMAPLFVASALDSGLALLIIVLVLLKAFKVFSVEKKLITTLAGLLVTFIAVDAYLLFSEILTLLWPGAEGPTLILQELTSGSMAPFFWGEVILGIAIPIMILLFRKNREKTSLVIFSSALVVIGVLFKRVWLLFTAFLHPNVSGAPGVTFGKFVDSGDPTNLPNFWTLQGTYTPTMVEGMLIIGVIAFGILLFTVLSNRILVAKTTKEDENVSAQTFVS